MTTMNTKKKRITRKPKASKSTKVTKAPRASKKSQIEKSVVEQGQIFCINHTENTTPYWGGIICNESQPNDDSIVRLVCSACIAKLMPAPQQKQKVDPTTGEKRKRGRPRTRPEKIVKLGADGKPVKGKRGRPAGALNKKTIELKAKGLFVQVTKKPVGRPRKVAK